MRLTWVKIKISWNRDRYRQESGLVTIQVEIVIETKKERDQHGSGSIWNGIRIDMDKRVQDRHG